MWQNFAKIGPGTSKIWWTEKKEKETRPKYNSLPLSRATVIIDAESAQILHTRPQLTTVTVDQYHNTRHLPEETANTFCTMLSAADTIPDKQCRLCILIRLSVNTTQTTHYYCSRPSTQDTPTSEWNHTESIVANECWTLRQQDISPTRHFAYDMDTSPNGHFAYWTVRPLNVDTRE